MKTKKFWAFKAKDDKTGELALYSEISSSSWWGDEVTPKQFKEDMDALGDIDTLNVYINSPGGDVFAGQAIYSMLKRCQAKVVVSIDGLAASIASLIAMAGETVIMPANAMMMVHNPWTWMAGNAADFRKLADDMDKMRDSMLVAYKSRSELSDDELIALLDAETWLSAEDCLNYGFCDQIEEAKEAAASLDKQFVARYHNVPDNICATSAEEEGEPPDGDDELRKRRLSLELELL